MAPTSGLPGATESASTPRRLRDEHDRPLARCQRRDLDVGRIGRFARAHRARRTSPRKAFPRGACAAVAGVPPPRSRASAIRWKPPRPFTATICRRASAAAAACKRVVAHRQFAPLRRPTAPVAARRPGRHWARRGSGGRPGSRIRPGIPGTWRSGAWSCARGRRADR